MTTPSPESSGTRTADEILETLAGYPPRISDSESLADPRGSFGVPSHIVESADGVDHLMRGRSVPMMVVRVQPLGQEARVLDGAGVELAFARRRHGDVGQPQRVWARSAEVPLDQIVVDRRPWGLGVAATPHRGRRPDAVLPAQPVDPSFARLVASSLKLVGDEAITELGIVGMDVDDGVGQVGVVEVPLADRVGLPLLEPRPRSGRHEVDALDFCEAVQLVD